MATELQKKKRKLAQLEKKLRKAKEDREANLAKFSQMSLYDASWRDMYFFVFHLKCVAENLEAQVETAKQEVAEVGK